MKTNLIKVLVGIAVAAVVMTAVVWLRNSKQTVKVGITQIVSHPGLDEVHQGIVKGLEARGYRDGQKIQILFRNANGDPSLTLPIAQDFVRRGVSVMVPITTPSALGAAKSSTTIPIVFGGVTDPVGVGLVTNLDHPGGNITGTSDRWPFEEQVRFFAKLLPNVRRVGMLYKPGDDVSKIGVEAAKKEGQKLNIEIVAEPVSNPGDLYASAVSLFRRVDAIYTGMDNLVVENLESLLKASKEAGKPVLAGDAGSVGRGALASVATSMTDLGVLTGEMVADVLGGKKPGDMPIRVVTGGKAVVNREAAKAFGIEEERVKQLGAEMK
ncbi:MAG: ABC transporter substrate-binding protein [Limisphaerales bacterium]